MSNCSIELKGQIFDDAMNIAKYHATHRMIDSSTIFYPAHTKGKVKNMKGAADMARRKVKAINLKYESARYGKVATFNNGFVNGVGIDVNVPDVLVNEIERRSNLVNEIEISRDML